MNEPAAAFRVNLWLAVAAGLVAAVVGAFIWYGMYKTMQNALIPPLLIGLIVGGAMRLAGGKARDHRTALIACGLTVLSGAAGYFLADSLLWNPFILTATVKRFLNDIQSLLLIAVGAYIAYLFTRPTLTP